VNLFTKLYENPEKNSSCRKGAVKNIVRRDGKENRMRFARFAQLNHEKRWRRAAALLLALSMLFSFLPVSLIDAVDESEVDHSKVSVGSIVKVEKHGKEVEYTIVGSNEVDFWSGKISDQSPIGAALIGAREGDTVTVETPDGTSYPLKLLSVSRVKLNG